MAAPPAPLSPRMNSIMACVWGALATPPSTTTTLPPAPSPSSTSSSRSRRLGTRALVSAATARLDPSVRIISLIAARF